MFLKIVFLIGFLGLIVFLIGYLFYMIFENSITYSICGIGFYMFIIPVIIFLVYSFVFLTKDILYN